MLLPQAYRWRRKIINHAQIVSVFGWKSMAGIDLNPQGQRYLRLSAWFPYHVPYIFIATTACIIDYAKPLWKYFQCLKIIFYMQVQHQLLCLEIYRCARTCLLDSYRSSDISHIYISSQQAQSRVNHWSELISWQVLFGIGASVELPATHLTPQALPPPPSLL